MNLTGVALRVEVGGGHVSNNRYCIKKVKPWARRQNNGDGILTFFIGDIGAKTGGGFDENIFQRRQ